MREPTDREYAAAKRAVAKVAKKVREISGNPTVRGHVTNAYVDEGCVSYSLTCNYDYLGVGEALKKVEGVRKIYVSNSGLRSDGEIDVTYPKGN